MSVEERIKLLPPVTAANRPFWAGAEAGELRLQVCDDCGKHRFPDSQVCPNCLSHAATWQPVSGRGKVWSWIRMHQNYLPAFSEQLPYIVLFVELDEGPRLMSSFQGDPETLAIDMPVEVVFESLGDARVVPSFRSVA